MSRLWTGRHNIGDKHQSITKCYTWVDVLSERVEGGAISSRKWKKYRQDNDQKKKDKQ